MYIIMDKNDVVFYMSESLDYQSNGNLLVDNGALAIAKVLVKDVFEVEEVPSEVEAQKYCYTEEKGFYKNENYKEFFTEEQRISALEDVVNNLLGFQEEIKMSENLKNYLKIQVTTGKLTAEEVIEKYPEMEEFLR